jgi:hypothetical protein
MGHSEVGVTLDLYLDVLPDLQSEAAARVDDVMQGALNRRRDVKG